MTRRSAFLILSIAADSPDSSQELVGPGIDYDTAFKTLNRLKAPCEI